VNGVNKIPIRGPGIKTNSSHKNRTYLMKYERTVNISNPIPTTLEICLENKYHQNIKINV
jgi:hypothetical protein